MRGLGLRFTGGRAVVLALLLGIGAWACSGGYESAVAPSSTTFGSLDAKPGGPSAYQLNLSHIECVDPLSGSSLVEIHFVLLNVPNGVTPGDLTYSLEGVVQPPVVRDKRTGNVWHYSVLVPQGTIDVTAASVDVGGTVVQLHNPSAYAGDYTCGELPLCQAVLPVSDLICYSHPLGNPESECAEFGLSPLLDSEGEPIKQDGDGSSLSLTADVSAAFAIVKDGRGSCGIGQQAYRTYANVTAGDVLQTPTGAGAISHITYCGCPDVP